MFRIAVVGSGVIAACLLGGGVAMADDTEGGHCEYGDASLVIMPSCDTSNSDGNDRQLQPVLQNPPPLQDVTHDLPGAGTAPRRPPIDR